MREAERALRLDGVPDGVPEVEQPSETPLVLVLFDDAALVVDAEVDQAFEVVFRARLHDVIYLSASEHGIFHRLAEPALPLRPGEGGEHVEVAHHRLRGIDPAREVLARFEVDRSLAAHGRVDDGEQSGGHLHIVYPAHVRARDKPRQVPHDAAAERDDHAVAGHIVRGELLEELTRKRPVFALFAMRDDDVFCALRKDSEQLFKVQRRDVVVGDDGDFVSRRDACGGRGLANDAVPRDDGIAPRGCADEGLHCASCVFVLVFAPCSHFDKTRGLSSRFGEFIPAQCVLQFLLSVLLHREFGAVACVEQGV